MPGFLTLLTRTQVHWDILVLTECWLSTAHSIPDLDGYSHISTTIHGTQNEGVVIYYRKQLNVLYEEPQLSDVNCLVLKMSSEICVIGIYRPPSQYNTTNFIGSLHGLISKLSNYKNIIICGDINIDIVQNSKDKRSYEFLNALASHGMLPGHNMPTHGHTCLDHIIMKTKLDATCLIIESSVTDHDSVAVSINLKSQLTYVSKSANRIDFEALDKEINNIDFQDVICCNDVNNATELLVSRLRTAIENNSKTIKVPARKYIQKPWITKGLLRCMKNRDNLHKKLKRDPGNDILRTTYKRYRNFCTSLIKKEKRNFEKQEITNAKNNKRELWNVIKGISSSSKKCDHSYALLSPETPTRSVNEVNNFLAGVGKRLAEQIANGNYVQDTSTVVGPRATTCNSFALLPTDEAEIESLILGLRDSCAVGIDLISGKLIKRYVRILTPLITHLCNLALSTGTFPKAFKAALIKPIHKGGDRDCVNNYRPISILPSLSKILERLMNNRLTKYLEANNLLSESQFGFRSGKSTDDAVHDLINAIVSNIDAKKKCVTVFLDLAKAFDTVSVPHLLEKLERIGVRGLPLQLFRDYLSNRTQRVKIDSWISDEVFISYGVPQGSILGPTLFLVYINDLCQLKLLNGQIFSFADDTALFFRGESWKHVFESAQTGFNEVCRWLRSNVLTLNVSKTKYMAFAHRKDLLPPAVLSITAHSCPHSVTSACQCPLLQGVETIKYLGVIVDQTLSFKPHLDALVARLRKLIYIFKTLRHIADRRITKMVYYALCQSLINYCITTWGGAAKTHIIEVERAQRVVLKVGAGLPFRFSTTELYSKWDVLTVRQTFVLNIVLKKHSNLAYDPDLARDSRRKGRICQAQKLNTQLSHRFYCFLGSYLYNIANSSLDIYSQLKFGCKASVTKWLKKLDYNATEKLLHPMK